MKLNAKKTKSLIVSRSRTVNPPHPQVLVSGCPIDNSDHLTILGINFDSKFNFIDHSVFSSFYLCDIQHEYDGLLSLGPFVAAGSRIG